MPNKTLPAYFPAGFHEQQQAITRENDEGHHYQYPTQEKA